MGFGLGLDAGGGRDDWRWLIKVYVMIYYFLC